MQVTASNLKACDVRAGRIRTAEIVLPCADLDRTLAFFTERLGFRVAAIFPADAPTVAVVAGHGLRIRLDPAAAGDPGLLRLLCEKPDGVAGGTRSLIAPNGTRIEIVDSDPPVAIPPLRPELVITRLGDGAAWHQGRAGLAYRDLIPGRLGGRFVASNIRLAEGGPVADYVHFHKVRFQLIYCVKGWVRVVYEDQGESFVMHAGDCVLQPPRIRHRVLESSAGMEVVEVACPALHETLADPDLELPNSRRDPQRDFSGQRFVRHVAAGAPWQPWRAPGFEARDLGIAEATDDLAGAWAVRGCRLSVPSPPTRHQAEFDFMFVCSGSVTLEAEGAHRLGPGDCCVVPPGLVHALRDASSDLEFLQVTLPALARRPPCPT
jgi:quercetin dioxygenase-like cupin family protein